jgi:hypothetical protein
MKLALDTSVIIAALDGGDPDHAACRKLLLSDQFSIHGMPCRRPLPLSLAVGLPFGFLLLPHLPFYASKWHRVCPLLCWPQRTF